MTRSKIALKGKIVAVLANQKTGEKQVHIAKNIVTNEGDLYYAQRAAAETPDTDFSAGGIRLGTGFVSADKNDTDVDTEDSNGRLDPDAGYPKTNDDDTDNSGSGTDIVTWRFSYTTGEGNITDIDECAVVDDKASPTKALCHAQFSPTFTKTSSDTLKVFVNHTFNGT